ncbi:GMC family oxidoreductase N-terminal domain-containing protein [Streptomyces sp. cg40]|uniref:GMC family oxidoreductase N-terminal domain-containing protein n=1 Tax=Streptomyces sp. cg40 TaxID=3419764 RepID=UPI003D068D10
MRDGRRVSAWTAFVQPVLDSPLLTVLTGAPVVQVPVVGGRACGVEGGRTVAVRSTGDVVLSGGTIGAAQLLLRSGIGPADELRAIGIGVVADLPGVGPIRTITRSPRWGTSRRGRCRRGRPTRSGRSTSRRPIPHSPSPTSSP